MSIVEHEDNDSVDGNEPDEDGYGAGVEDDGGYTPGRLALFLGTVKRSTQEGGRGWNQ